MESAIRDCQLRLLTLGTPHDVILSCRGQKLKAHKLILSTASSVLYDLLLQDTADPTVLIFPDIDGSTMSLILDYVYNGNVTVPKRNVSEFFGIANLLKLYLELDFFQQKKAFDFDECKEPHDNKYFPKFCEGNKSYKKIPKLMPISALQKSGSSLPKKGLYNRVFPSPWCPRLVPLDADPRTVNESNTKSGNDPNNNLKSQPPENSTFSEKEGPINYKSKKLSKGNPLKTEDQKSPKHETFENFSAKEETVKSALKSQPLNKQKPYECQDCGKAFSQLRNYKYHRSVHEGTKEFAAHCPECGKLFNDKGYLSSHLKIHRDRKEYACPHCPKRFNQRVAYNMHLRIHTGVKPHKCPTCAKTFSRKMLLKQHQRVHTGERPYSCSECGKTFADRSNMSLHTKLHSGIKPYVCNLCPKSFTKKHHLKTHMNFHTGLKPYSCQKCGLAFSQSSNMRTHYKNVF